MTPLINNENCLRKQPTIVKGEYLGRFVNAWRQRCVAIYSHSTDPQKVVTVGTPFGGGPLVECIENRKDYEVTLKHIEVATSHGGVYIYE